MPKIIVTSIDADGCYLAKSLNSGTEYQPTLNQKMDAVLQNMPLIEDIGKVYSEGDEIVVMCGSNRQSLAADWANSRKGKTAGTGSFYPYLEELVTSLKLGKEWNVSLDKFLLADDINGLPHGTTWETCNDEFFKKVKEYDELTSLYYDTKTPASERVRVKLKMDALRNGVLAPILKNDSSVNKDKPKKDETKKNEEDINVSKVALLSAQMEKISLKAPINTKVEFRFYDNEDAILRGAQTISEDVIPENVELVLLKYDPKNLNTIVEVSRKQGTRPVSEIAVPVPSPKPEEPIPTISTKYRDMVLFIQTQIIGINKNNHWDTRAFSGVDKKIAGTDNTVHITKTMNEILNCFQLANKEAKKRISPIAKEVEFKEALHNVHDLVQRSYIPGNKSWYSSLFGRYDASNNFYGECLAKLDAEFGSLQKTNAPAPQPSRTLGLDGL